MKENTHLGPIFLFYFISIFFFAALEMNDYACFYIFEKTKITSISRKIICCMVPANANILYMLFPVKR